MAGDDREVRRGVQDQDPRLTHLAEIVEQGCRIADFDLFNVPARVQELEAGAHASREAWDAAKDALFESERRIEEARRLLRETDLPVGAFSILPCARDGADLFTVDDREAVLRANQHRAEFVAGEDSEQVEAARVADDLAHLAFGATPLVVGA